MNQDLINAAFEMIKNQSRIEGAREVINQLEDRLGVKFDKTEFDIADELRKGVAHGPQT